MSLGTGIWTKVRLGTGILYPHPPEPSKLGILAEALGERGCIVGKIPVKNDANYFWLQKCD